MESALQRIGGFIQLADQAIMSRRVLTSNLSSQGYGEAVPIADNDTAEGREANRRITFSLVHDDHEGHEHEEDESPAADTAPVETETAESAETEAQDEQN